MTLRDTSVCEHEWTDARNKHVISGEICLHCGAIRSGNRDTNNAALARALLSLADAAGMPDSFWTTDKRIRLAREALSVPEDGRYSHAHLWTEES